MTSKEPLQLPRKYSILCVDDDLIGLGLQAALLDEEGVLCDRCWLPADGTGA